MYGIADRVGNEMTRALTVFVQAIQQGRSLYDAIELAGTNAVPAGDLKDGREAKAIIDIMMVCKLFFHGAFQHVIDAVEDGKPVADALEMEGNALKAIYEKKHREMRMAVPRAYHMKL